jgi:hypothetical protein
MYGFDAAVSMHPSIRYRLTIVEPEHYLALPNRYRTSYGLRCIGTAALGAVSTGAEVVGPVVVPGAFHAAAASAA